MAAKWQQLMAKVQEIKGRSNGLLWERTKLLVEIADDATFLEFYKGDHDKAVDALDSEVGDYGLSFADVRTLFTTFPKKLQWEQGKLRTMLAEAMAMARKERLADAEPITRPRVTKKDFEQAIEQKQQVEKRAEFLESEVDQLRRRNDELTAENRRLTAELARAEGRISELERMVNRREASIKS